MRSSWAEPYLWVHLTGIAAVPIFLELCLVGLAASQAVLPAGIGFLLVALVGISPILWMQWHRPFSIFSLIALSLKPRELTETQRRILQCFKTPVAKVVAVIVAILAFLILWQLNQWLPLAPVLKVPGGWLGGLVLAAVAFLLSNLFLQVPASVLMVLLTPESRIAAATPYPVAQIPADFTLIGLQVKQILPPIVLAPAPVGSPAAVANPPVVPVAEAPLSKPAESEISQPEAIQPEAVQPETVQPEAIQPESLQPEATQPEAIEPETIQAETVQPEAIQPEVIQPESLQPEVIEPEIAHLEVIEPEAIQAESLQPEVIEPETIQTEAIEPEIAQTEAIQLETTQPKIDEPELSQSETSQPENTEPPILEAEAPDLAESAPHSEPVEAELNTAAVEVESRQQEPPTKADAATGRQIPQVTDTVVKIEPSSVEAASPLVEAVPSVDPTQNGFKAAVKIAKAEPSTPPLPSVSDTIITIQPPQTDAEKQPPEE